MNHGISILFRVIPVVMAFICFFLGGFIFLYGDDGARQVAGPVVFFLGAICLALFATAATIIRQLIHKFHTVLKYIIPGFGYVVAFLTIVSGIWIFGFAENSNFIVSGHVVAGVGLITACVSTAATSSTKFYLIPANSANATNEVNKEGFSAMTQNVLIGLTLLFSLTAWVWAIVLLSRIGEGAYFLVAGTVMGGLACICTSLIALVASIAKQFEEGLYDNAFFVPARVLVGLGAICFCLFSIVSILESGTSKK